MRQAFVVSFIAIFSCLPAAAAPATDDAARALLVGSWDLVSLENHAADGSVNQPFGAAPIGRITYTAEGHMSAQIMHDTRAPFAADALYGGSPEERAAAYAGYIAYYGGFTVDPVAGVVRHHVTSSLFPNWVGSEQVRHYVLNGDQLTLSAPSVDARGQPVTAQVVWRRVR